MKTAFITATLALVFSTWTSAAPSMVAHWGLDEDAPPYASSAGTGIPLELDTSTTEPIPVKGTVGGAIYLDYRNDPGVSTRLHAAGPGLQTDSFGFSFWISPADMHPGNNLIAKEMAPAGGPNYSRLAWQVQVGSDNGSGLAPLEFVVRGDNRTAEDYFGNVFSAVTVPLQASRDQWFHVAGGYDSTNGHLSLFINGLAATANGLAGAHNSDGSWLSVGTVRNGLDPVAFAALACIDDLRIYDGPLSAWDVDALQHLRGRQAKLLAHWQMDEAATPFADSAHRAAALDFDPATTGPILASGVSGDSAGLNWQNPPGVSTRLAAHGGAVQSDSFGFSFWVHPVNIAPSDNLIGKEMLPTASGSNFTRLAWNVAIGADDGSGMAPLMLVVRGTERATTDFRGDLSSSVKLPLYVNAGSWYHIAGGYDSVSGRLLLHVNGVETTAQGVPGATCSDGGAFVVGTLANDMSYIAFAATADIDQVQLYDGPLWANDAAWLIEHPSQSIPNALIANFSGSLVAHWKLDESGTTFADSSGHLNPLEVDQVSSPQSQVAGVDGNATLLSWQETQGVTTRFFASGTALQTDSFGFSFWMKPSDLSPGENLIAKEMPPDGGPDFTRMEWQVQIGQDNGMGQAPLELVVRGGDRTKGDFFGSVTSVIAVPLHAPIAEWLHVAGGYDAKTGVISIFLNGQEAANLGIPGADNSDGTWFNVGSVRNGLDFVAFGVIAAVDDIQLYNAPLPAYEVTWLRKNPGKSITPGMHFKTTGFSGGTTGDQFVTFNSHSGWFYTIEASTALASFVPVATIAANAESTTVQLTKPMIDNVLGSAPRPRLFFRVRALIEDPVDGSVDLPPAEILPFVNPAAYVPQYHFSWQYAAVGDPSGALKYNGSYHLFTWDHAQSKNLLNWDGLGWPLGTSPPDSGYWTGSVVVDKNNTSGFGSLSHPPMVAIYTIHNNTTGKENIGISYSTDFQHFTQYGGNPVINTPDQVFRDPDVFWHEPTQRWILLVARSEAQQIQFYTSQDLKTWVHASNFGPVGARQEIWEVPGLAQIPIRGNGNQKKWMLHCGAGTNKVQYWVGNFDGITFTMDESTRAYLEDGTGIDGELFADFEEATWQDTGWTTTGDAFGSGPVPRSAGLPAQGHLGQRLASSYTSFNSDYRVNSTLTSPEFTITRNCINFLIGGGNHSGETCINLIVGGNVVRSTTGDDSDVIRCAGWNVAEFKGQQATIRIVDNFGGFWGRIYVDHITFSDVMVDHRREYAKWVETGPDFFAPKFVRDYDGTETDVKWLAWIGSWEYEANRPVPNNWGKGAETIFRKLQLVPSARGYDLAQEPVSEMQQLRGPEVSVLPQNVQGTKALTEFQPATNTYEMEVVFALNGTATDFGVKVCVGGTQHVDIGFDRVTSNIFLDRRESGNVSLDPSFPRIISAAYKPTGDQLKLRVFVDQSSIEVFTEDGLQVLTSQIYPDTSGTGVELFSNGGTTTLRSLRAWLLASIWKP